MRRWLTVLYYGFLGRKNSTLLIMRWDVVEKKNPDIEEVNALLCTSAKVGRGPKTTEEVLNEAEGLDWKTMVRCDRIHLLPKARFEDRKGNVTEERRHLIARKMVEVLRLPLYRK